MLLDSYYAKGLTNNGNRVAGAPDFVATARVAYSVPEVAGLRLYTDAKYTGQTALRAAGGVNVADYTVYNIGASYTTKISGYGVTFRAAVHNLADKKYWMFQYADYVRPGDPRTYSLNASVNF